MPEAPPLRQRFVLDISRYQRAIAEARRDARGFSESMTQEGRRAARGLGPVERSLGRLSGLFLRLRQAAAGVAVAMAARFSLRALVGINLDAEKLTKTFTTLTGSADTARKMLESLYRFAERTPFKTQDITDAAETLLLFGGTAETVQDELTMLGNIAIGTGQPIGELARIFGQVRVQGHLAAGQVTQFLKQGIPIAEILAEKWGKNRAEIHKLVNEGRVGFDALLAVMKELTSEGGRFGAAMAQETDTVGGVLRSLSNTFQNALRDFGSGLFEELGTDLRRLRDRIQELRESGTLDRWSQQVADGLRAAYRWFRDVLDTLRDWGPTLLRVATAIAVFRGTLLALRIATAAISGSLGVLNALLGAFRFASILAAGTLANFAGNATRAAAAARLLNITFRATPWGFVIGALTSAAALLLTFRDRTSEAARQQRHLADQLRDTIKEIKNMDGAMLLSELRAQSRRTSTLRNQIQSLQEENALLRSSFVQVDTAPTRNALGMVTEEGYEKRLGQQRTNANIQRSIDENLKGIASKEKEILAIQKLREAATERITGSLELQAEVLREVIRSITDKPGIITDEDEARVARYKRQLEEIDRKLESRRGIPGPAPAAPGGIRDEDLQRARELEARMRELAERAGELAGEERDIANLLREIHGLEDDILKIKEAQTRVRGTQAAADLQLLVDEKEDAIKVIRGRIDLINELRREIEDISEGAADLAISLGLRIEAGDVDKRELVAALELEIAELQQSLEAKTQDVKARINLLDKDAPDYVDAKNLLEEDLVAFQEDVTTRTARILGFVLARGVGFATDVVQQLNAILSQIHIDDAVVRQFGDQIEGIMSNFDKELLGLTVKLALDANVPEFEQQSKALGEKVKAALRNAFQSLSSEDQKKVEAAFEAAWRAVDMQIRQAMDSADRFLVKLEQLRSLFSNLQSAADAFGASDGLTKSLGSIVRMVEAVKELRDAIKDAQKNMDALSKASFLDKALSMLGVFGAAGAVAGQVAQLVGGLGLSGSGDREMAERKRQAEATLKLEQTMRNAAKEIVLAVDRLVESTRISGNQAIAFRDLLMQAGRDVKAAPVNIIGFPPVDQNTRILTIIDNLFNAIEALGIPDLDVGALREWVASQRKLGVAASDIWQALLDGGLGLGTSLREIGDRLFTSFGASVEEAGRRLRFFQQFLGVGQEALADYAEFLRNRTGIDLPLNLERLFRQIAGEAFTITDPFSGQVLEFPAIDVNTEEGQKALNDALKEIAEWFDRVGVGGLRGLTEQDFMTILTTLLGFTTGPIGGEVRDIFKGARLAMENWLRFMEGNATGALRRFVDALQEEDVGTDVFRSLLEELEGIDLDTDAGQEALNDAIKRVATDLDTMTDSELLSRYGLARDQLTTLLDVLSSLRSIRDDDFEGILNRATAAMRLWTTFLEGDATGAIKRFAETILETPEIGTPEFRSTVADLGKLDLNTEEGTAELNRVIKAIATDLDRLSDDELLAKYGIAREGLVGVLDALSGLLDARAPVTNFGEALDRATNAMRIWVEFLGGDATGAVNRFLESLIRSGFGSETFQRLLGEIVNRWDLTTEKGRQGFEEFKKSIAAALDDATRSDEDLLREFGLNREDLQAFLEAITGARLDDDPRTASRSVQFIRQFTEFQGNELLIFASERNLILRDIRGLLKVWMDRPAIVGQAAPVNVDIPAPESPEVSVSVPSAETPESPEVSVSVPSPDIDAPVVNVDGADVRVEAPAVNVEAPDINVETPDVSLEAPAVNVEAPDVRVEAPDINVETPDVRVEAPDVNVEAPDVSLEAPSAAAPVVNVDVPSTGAPDVNVDVPSTGAPDVNVEAPSAAAPVVNVTIPPAEAPRVPALVLPDDEAVRMTPEPDRPPERRTEPQPVRVTLDAEAFEALVYTPPAVDFNLGAIVDEIASLTRGPDRRDLIGEGVSAAVAVEERVFGTPDNRAPGAPITINDLRRGGDLYFDLDVWASPSVDEIARKLDQQIREGLKRGFNRPKQRN